MVREILAIPDGLAGVVWPFWPLRPTDGRYHHTHEELECNLVTRGEASYLIGSDRVLLRPGRLVWLFPEQAHVLLGETPDFAMWICVARQALLARHCTTPETAMLRQGDPGAPIVATLDADTAHRLHLLCERLATERDDAATFDAGLAWLILSAWHATRLARAHATSANIHPAVARAAFLLCDEAAPASLADLARQCGLSAAHLSRLFARELGLSIPAYRNRQRIERALGRLAQGRRINLLTVALESGFGSYAQFHRVFKQVMGTGPAAYLRERAGGNSSGQK
ncbi:MAG: AraC family transcriptional regulator, partial [Alphaproteobacteria bacterium]